jgi:hypothetical protein
VGTVSQPENEPEEKTSWVGISITAAVFAILTAAALTCALLLHGLISVVMYVLAAIGLCVLVYLVFVVTILLPLLRGVVPKLDRGRDD